MFNWLAGPDYDLGQLGVDMHAHWLPGIDDGAKAMDETLAMIRGLVRQGFTHLIATPHIMADFYQNDPAIIRAKLQEVRTACRAEGIAVDLDAAAEYLVDEGFETHLATHGAMTLPGNRLLVEFGFFQPPADMMGVVFRLRSAGYGVVLAHPERYSYYHRDDGQLRALVSRGVELQVNLLSLLGHYGKAVRNKAVELIKRGQVTFLGTDAHRVDHINRLSALSSKRSTRNLLSKASFSNRQLLN